VALQWFLEHESGRQYGLSVLASLSSKRAVVPILWFYEVGNGLLMAYRRKRITFDQIDGFLTRQRASPLTPPSKFQRKLWNCQPSPKTQSDELRRGVPRIGNAIPFAFGNNRCRTPAGGRGGRRRYGACIANLEDWAGLGRGK
jgi:hypothetical protein